MIKLSAFCGVVLYIFRPIPYVDHSCLDQDKVPKHGEYCAAHRSPKFVLPVFLVFYFIFLKENVIIYLLKETYIYD